jgi:hypothetical protein
MGKAILLKWMTFSVLLILGPSLICPDTIMI